MGDCVESLAEVEVDNIHGSPFVYPGLRWLMLVLCSGRSSERCGTEDEYFQTVLWWGLHSRTVGGTCVTCLSPKVCLPWGKRNATYEA